MNDSFSFSRLGLLVRKQWMENARFYLISTLALVGLHALVFAIWMVANSGTYSEDFTYAVYMVGLFLAGCVFASNAFSMLGNKDKGIYWLGFPASHLEKLLCTIFFTTILFILAYSASFFLVKSIAVPIIKSYILSHPGHSWQPTGWGRKDNDFPTIMGYLFCTFIAVQALYLMGSVYFTRASFLITTIIGAALIFAFIFYLDRIYQWFLANRYVMWDGLTMRTSYVNGPGTSANRIYHVSEWLRQSILFLLKFGWAPVFWTITYFRLKEKEI